MTNNAFNAEQELYHQLKKLNISLTQSAIDALLIHFNQVEEWGIPLGLTHAKGKELLLKHTIDSLAALPYMQEKGIKSVLDIGSGAGFPGLCLAATMSETQFFLAERKQKRLGFLITTKALMALKNVVVVDDINKVKEPVDCVTFRALTALNVTTTRRYLTHGDQIIAYKGRLSEVEKEASLLQSSFNTTVIPLVIPSFNEERSLLVVTAK